MYDAIQQPPPTISETWLQRLRNTLRLRDRDMTAEEVRLRNEVERLTLDVGDRDVRILTLETDILKMKAGEKIHELELKKLLAVIERDRLRVEAESARLAAEIVQATEMPKFVHKIH